MANPKQFCWAKNPEDVQQMEPKWFFEHDPGPTVGVMNADDTGFWGIKFTKARVCKRCGMIYMPFKKE